MPLSAAAMMKTRLDNILMPTELTAVKDEQFINEAMRSACGYLQVVMPDHDE